MPMALMLVSCIFLYLGCLSAAGYDDIEEKIVHVGDPVTLSCYTDPENVDPSKITWKTHGNIVARISNGKLTSDCGYEGRVQISKSIAKGDLSLTIHRTVYNDFGEYECWYNGEHKTAWSLKITANIPKKLEVTAGDPVSIPCFTRQNKGSQKGMMSEDISFEWKKDEKSVLRVERGGIMDKADEVDFSDDVHNGNLSLIIAQAFFSDRGTYRCNGDIDVTCLLVVSGHKKRREVSLEDRLSLQLYTVDPVIVYFQRDHYSTPVIVCNGSQCSPGWIYVKNGHKVELNTVTRDHIGIYTVRDRQSDELLCTYNVQVTTSEGVYIHNIVHVVYFFLVSIISIILASPSP
ncbi:uncharacterized protein LOC134459106 [Engraulis encrasicolus]|uniref:uncharacterized protein LOC134459106 n=1 Tax=Engraulis encrasicolus TaxID=184585 RepID=UPI002FD35CB3